MRDYGSNLSVDKQTVLSLVSQEDIMSHYLGIPVETGVLYKSPLRHDRNPTCGFAYVNQKLYFRDFQGHFFGDCFDVVMKVRNCSFPDALSTVLNDLYHSNGSNRSILKDTVPNREYKNFEVNCRESWNSIDKAFWKPFGITSGILQKFEVFPMKFGWINGTMVYRHKDSDPGYVYFVKENEDNSWKMKFYLPFREKGKKFMGNCGADDLFGYNQIPEKGDSLIITKSLKDVMSLYSLGFTSVGLQAESMCFSGNIWDDLSSRFTNIISLLDYDYAGVKMANHLKKKFNVPYMFLTNGKFNTYDYKAKDISDFVKKYGKEKTELFIKTLDQ